MRNPFRKRKSDRYQVQPMTQSEIDDVMERVPAEIDIQPEQRAGHIVRVSAPPEFVLGQKRDGGRVVRTMPRSLRKLKEASEK